MNAIVFDGVGEAKSREQDLAQQVSALNFTPRIASIYFPQDQASVIYTNLKKQAAVRVGIEFDITEAILTNQGQEISQIASQICQRADIHGLLIQKPSKKVWQQANSNNLPTGFDDWWHHSVSGIMPQKDADCLTKTNLDLVYSGQWQIMPATVKGIILIIEKALNKDLLKSRRGLEGINCTVIGRSDIVGRPLAAILEQFGAMVELCGSTTQDLNIKCSRADILISATGNTNLVSADLVKKGSVVIDVGSPKGDINFDQVKSKAAFITPVPDGVGPMTVISLLENLYQLASQNSI